MACGTLKSVAPNCTTKPTLGLYNEIYLISLKNYQEATKTETSGVVSSITLPAGGEQAYKWESRDNAFKLKITSEKDETGADTYPAVMEGFVEDRDTATKDFLKYLVNNRVVVIARLRGGTDENSFQIIGKDAGLIGETIELDSTANNGAFHVMLQNPTVPVKNNEPELPLNFWNTDLATTNAALDALLIPTA